VADPGSSAGPCQWLVGVQLGAAVLVLVPAESRWRAWFERNMLCHFAREYGWRTAPERYQVFALTAQVAPMQGDAVSSGDCRVDVSPWPSP
jgi:hypothetical protein